MGNNLPLISILGLGTSNIIPELLKHYLRDLKKIGCVIVFDEEAPEGDLTILVFGLNPVNHEIPPILEHYLKKMQKDFPIAYGVESKHPVYANLLKQTGFVPTPKKRIIT